MLTKTNTCPYCFQTIDLREAPYRCTNDPLRCPPEEDPVYTSFWDRSSKNVKSLGKVFMPQRNGASALQRILAGFRSGPSPKCPQCGEVSTTRLCPLCHSSLPYTIGHYREFIIAIIGGKESGKSHYLSVLIHAIKNEIGQKFDCNLQAVNEETLRRYRREFYEPVFQNRTTIHATRPARTDKSVRSPLIYTLSFLKEGLNGIPKISDAATMSFFDMAGEDLNSEEILQTENKYIYRSQGIIVLLDPLQLPAVRSQLRGKVELPNQNAEIEDILARTANLIRKGLNIKGAAQIDIPIAVAFSKCDAIRSLLSPESCLSYDSRHNGIFNLADFRSASTEMEGLLAEWKGESLLNQLRLNFKNYALFGLSSLGCNPHGSDDIPFVHPMRVADPFLWLLWQKRLIPAREGD